MNARTTLLRGALTVLVSVGAAAQAQPTAVSEINSGATEKSPFLTTDGRSLYFSRQDPGLYPFTRIYQATRAVPFGPFTAVGEVPGLTHGGGHVDSVWVSPDDLRLYYYRTEPGGLRRILMSERTTPADPWTAGTYVMELNALGRVIGPTLTADERLIVFAGQNLAGGLGGYDLWMAGRAQRTDPFGDANGVVPVNTSANEYHPALSADGLVLYFASDRSGTLALYRAERKALADPFTVPQAVPLPDFPAGTQAAFPSLGRENGLETLFFAANPTGVWDVYRLPLEVNEPNLTGDTYYVDAATGNDLNHGLTPDQAFETIQRGLRAALSGQTVVVRDGVYLGPGNTNLDFEGREVVLRSEHGPAHTVIDVQGAGRAIFFHRGEGAEAVVEGFTIRGGSDPLCGGIYCVGQGGPTIRDCVLTGNQGGRAAALYAHFENAATFEACVIRNNTSVGGTVRFENSAGTLRHCVVADNTVTGSGGAIQCDTGSAQPRILYCTVVGNHAAQYGGGLRVGDGAQPVLRNSILWGNTADLGGAQLAVLNAALQVSYCDVQGGRAQVLETGGALLWGEGNIDADPLLVDVNEAGLFPASERGRYWPAQDLWVLDAVTSPCIDAGDPTDDPAVEPLPNGDRVNLGALGGTVRAARSMQVPSCFRLDTNDDGLVTLQDLYDLIDAWLAAWEEALNPTP